MSDSTSGDSVSKRRKKSKKSSKKTRRKSKHDDEKRDGSLSTDSSDSSSTERRKRKEKKAKKKAKKQKKSKKSSRDIDVESSVAPTPSDGSSSIADRLRLLAEPMCGPDLSLATMPEAVKPKGPMTKEQWEKHQTTLRKVHDPETGRTRLIRGDGEIMEEIVTRDMHIAINKSATKADGAFFETVLGLKRHK